MNWITKILTFHSFLRNFLLNFQQWMKQTFYFTEKNPLLWRRQIMGSIYLIALFKCILQCSKNVKLFVVLRYEDLHFNVPFLLSHNKIKWQFVSFFFFTQTMQLRMSRDTINLIEYLCANFYEFLANAPVASELILL